MRGWAAGAAAVLVLGLGLAAPGCGGDHDGLRPLRVAVHTGALVDEFATAVAVGRSEVVTVAHVLDGGGHVHVGGRPARILRLDRGLDLAVLAVPGLRATPARLAPAGEARRLVVLRDGRPRALQARIVRRVTARVERRDGTGADRRPALELAAVVSPGDSGAAVTDAAGHVLGIVFARSSGSSRIAWATDASAVRSVVAAVRR